jgi:purine-nucleoside phosphorylase
MKILRHRALEAASFISGRIEGNVRIALIAGTGLGKIADLIDAAGVLNYGDIPHFPISTVPGHAGRLMWGSLMKEPVLALQGRFHLYEGYTPGEVTFPVRVLQELGVRTLILSNAAGGLAPDFKVGDLMIISDHINFTGANPLCGRNTESWGLRFPDMSDAYDKHCVRVCEAAGDRCGVRFRKGIYAGLAGPSLETPAEARFLRRAGADAVGFSTVLEVIAAVHARMRVLGISTITNVHNPDAPVPATVEEIIATADRAAERLGAVLPEIVETLHE